MCYARPGPRCSSSVNKTMNKAAYEVDRREAERDKIMRSLVFVEQKRRQGDLDTDKEVITLEQKMEENDKNQQEAEFQLSQAYKEFDETPVGQDELRQYIAEKEDQGRHNEAQVTSTRLAKAERRRERKMEAYRATHGDKAVESENDDHDESPRETDEPIRKENSEFDVLEVKDVVEFEGKKFHLSSSDNPYLGTPYSIRIQTNKELSPDQVSQVAGLVGYSYRGSIAGERLDYPVQDSPNSFIVAADTTKSARDDLGVAMEEFEEDTPSIVKEGSPVRKTDRKGPGTKGTRLIEGLGEDTEVYIYYES